MPVCLYRGGLFPNNRTFLWFKYVNVLGIVRYVSFSLCRIQYMVPWVLFQFHYDDFLCLKFWQWSCFFSFRHKVRELIDFIQDDDKLREERKKAKKNKDKYVGMSSDAMGMRFGKANCVCTRDVLMNRVCTVWYTLMCTIQFCLNSVWMLHAGCGLVWRVDQTIT